MGQSEWVQAIDTKASKPFVKYMNLNPNNYTVVENYYQKSCEGLWIKNFGFDEQF